MKIPPNKIRVKDRHGYGLEFVVKESTMNPLPIYQLKIGNHFYLYNYDREDKHFHYIGVRT